MYWLEQYLVFPDYDLKNCAVINNIIYCNNVHTIELWANTSQCSMTGIIMYYYIITKDGTSDQDSPAKVSVMIIIILII